MLKKLKKQGFDIQFVSHAQAILKVDFAAALKELEETLQTIAIPMTEIIGSGGGESKGTQRLRRALAAQQWRKAKFEIRKTINGVERESISHEVDHVRIFEGIGTIAMEIEWNNKDPFFDRDLENFKRLHAEGAISVGVILTRGTSLQEQLRSFVHRFAIEQKLKSFANLEAFGLHPTPRQRTDTMKRVERTKDPISFEDAWADHFTADKYGAATTHWKKLMDRVQRGVGNPCPLLLIGIPASVVSFNQPDMPDDDETENSEIDDAANVTVEP